MHPLLARLLKRNGLDGSAPPTEAQWTRFLALVERTYADGDQDRYTLERSLAISSREMKELYDDLNHRSQREIDAGAARLEETLAILEATQEAAPDGVLVLDRQFRVRRFNKRFLEMWGLAPFELGVDVEKAWLGAARELVVDPAALIAPLRDLLSDFDTSGLDEIALKDGRHFARHAVAITMRGEASFGRVWFFQDVSEQRRRENEIREAKRFLDSVIDNIPDVVFVKDATTLRHLRVNRAGCEQMGRTHAELIGRPLAELFGPELAAKFEEQDRAAIARGGLTEFPIAEVMTPAGPRAMRAKLLPIAGDDGEARYVLGICEDVTEQKRSEERLRQAKEEAEEACRIKSDFLSNMSHELRTPLNSIVGFARVLEDQGHGGLGERPLRYVRNIVRAGEHMLALVNDLLDLRKIVDHQRLPKCSAFDLRRAIDEAIDLVRPLLEERRHSLEIDCAPSLPPAYMEERALIQILVNLLSNAAKFTLPGGALVVRVVLEPERRLNIAVLDNGIGIAPADQARLFNYFEQLGAKHTHGMKGSGIGLALTKALVEQHGGTIGVQSAPGLGSTFSFTLPSLA